MAKKLIPNAPRWLRQRQRNDGSWRLWWEPPASIRKLGLEVEDLDPDRLTWSVRRAQALNKQADAAQSGKSPRSSGGRTIEALVSLYMRDPMYLERKPKTRQSYNGNLSIIRKKWGHHSVSAFTKPVLREWYLSNRSERGNTQAARLNAAMSILFNFAELKGWRPEGSNPCARLGIKDATPRRKRIATWAELDACVSAATDLGLHSMALACQLSCLQGQSQSTVIAAAPAQFQRVTMRRDGEQATVLVWNTKRPKTGARTAMEIHPELATELCSWLAANTRSDVLLIEERLERPYDEQLFQRRWREVRKQAAEACPSILQRGNPLQFRDFRRTFGVWARNGDASVDDVADVLANSAATNAALEDTYMPPSLETASRAVRAITRPEKNEKRRA